MLKSTWKAIKETAAYYAIAHDGSLWLAWVWNGEDVAPHTLHQEGYRFEQVGEV